MKHSSSPPTPSDFSAPRITRRHALIGLAALLAQAGFWSNPLSAAMPAATAALADTEEQEGLPA